MGALMQHIISASYNRKPVFLYDAKTMLQLTLSTQKLFHNSSKKFNTPKHHIRCQVLFQSAVLSQYPSPAAMLCSQSISTNHFFQATDQWSVAWHTCQVPFTSHIRVQLLLIATSSISHFHQLLTDSDN